MRAVTVVIPARNAALLVEGCLRTVVPQAEAMGARVVVVDDASTDDTAARAEALGARVERSPRPQGPYAARNRGWRRHGTDVVVFTDVRSRAHDGWLAGSVDRLRDPVAIVGADVRVVAGAGTGVAGRAAAHRQPLLASRSVTDRHLPFVATCSLATSRRVLEAVDGFADVRGGGDVDLCWRVQDAGLGTVAVADVGMDWVPRSSVRALVGQFHRYGSNTAWLQRRHDACPEDPVVARWKGWGGAVRESLAARHEPTADPGVLAVDVLCRIATYEGHRRAVGEVA